VNKRIFNEYIREFSMKILHVVPTFYPCLAAGGVVNAVYQLAKKQVQEENDVSVFTTTSCKEPMNLKDRYNVDGVKTYYFKNLSKISFIFSF